LVVTSAATVGLGRWAETFFGEKDSGKFVTDEVAGFLLTVLLFRTPDILVTVLWAFPMTRVIDIVKVPPARQLERIPGGWGVLLDDLLGSLYAALILHVIWSLSPHWFT
jgi:phosphatidylglycerophosphatase A